MGVVAAWQQSCDDRLAIESHKRRGLGHPAVRHAVAIYGPAGRE